MRLVLALILLAGCTTRYTLRAQSDAPRSTQSETAPLEVEPTVIQIGEISSDNLLLPSLQLSVASGPVLLVIDSPGGDVGAGFAFEDVMVAAQRRGIRITCYVPENGYAASMAGYLLQVCDHRAMSRRATLLFHSVSVSRTPGGTVSDVERFARELRELNNRLAIRIAGRLNVSMAYLQEKLKGDWWLGFSEALEVNAVDEVL